MSFVDTHDEAMAIVNEARAAERAGDKSRSLELLRAAYRREQVAACSLEPVPESEPTRTVLFRSAASLAFQAEDYQEACSLAFDGLTGNSPQEYSAELLEIASYAKFRLQLISQNLHVPSAEITLILRGPHVSIGLAPAKQTTLILRRIETLLRMRVGDFFKNQAKAAGLEWPVESTKLFDVFMRRVAAEEFAVAFQVGLHEQLSFGAASPDSQIIADFMRDLQVVINRGHSGAKPDKFSARVLKLEPDGKEVTSIEITSMISGNVISIRIPPRMGPTRAGGDGGSEKPSFG